MDNEYTEKRKYPRVRLAEAVHFHFKEDNKKFGGCLSSDISEGGLKLSFNEFVPLNTEMTLRVKLADVPEVIDATGKAVWVQQIPYSDRYRVGLEFEEVNPFQKEELRSYVASHRF